MLRITRSLTALLLGLCLAGCDGTPAPQSASPQPLPASIPYRPTKTRPDTAKQVVFAAEKDETAARRSGNALPAKAPSRKAATG
jgi:hypothetical protein